MFLIKNYKAIILFLFVILSEVIYLPFANYEYGEIKGVVYNWGDIVYSFFNQLGYMSLLPSIILFQTTKNIHSKNIYFSIVIWNIFEMIQEFNLILKLNSVFLIKCDSFKGDILQIIFIFTTVILSYYTHKKWSILYLLSLRMLHIFTHTGIKLKSLKKKSLKLMKIWKVKR